MPMLEERVFKTDDIYVPAKRRRMLNAKSVDEIAESMAKEGRRSAILRAICCIAIENRQPYSYRRFIRGIPDDRNGTVA